MVAFRQKAPPVEEVNLGGLHHKPGRSPRLCLSTSLTMSSNRWRRFRRPAPGNRAGLPTARRVVEALVMLHGATRVPLVGHGCRRDPSAGRRR
jgi:hypothetical protein